jgi:hypothetical protein
MASIASAAADAANAREDNAGLPDRAIMPAMVTEARARA